MTLPPIARGIFFLVISELIFVVAWCAIKVVGVRIPLFEVTFFRSAVPLLFLFPLTRWKHGSLRGKKTGILLLRGLFGCIAMFLSFYAMIHMQIGNASTLINTTPIFVAIFAPWLLGEPFKKSQFALVIVSFAGIALMLKPDTGIFTTASLYALLAAVSSAFAMVCVRRLASTDSILVVTLYFTAFSALASTPLALSNFVQPSPRELGLLISIGILATIAQLFLVKAYRYGHAATISPFSYSSVIGSYIAGIFIFSEVPNLYSIAGAGIIIACGVGIMLAAPKPEDIGQGMS